MSGVSATVCPWELVQFEATQQYQSVERTVYDNDGKPVLVEDEKTKEKIEKRIKTMMCRDQYVMTIKRILCRLTMFGEEVGNTKSSWQLQTGPDTAINYTATAKKYVCTSDSLEMVDGIAGEIRQTQSWLYLSDWEDVRDGAFE